jgi:UDP-N-acetylmuramoyl-tripeptide--D-alanyl-D-alanine ligase
MDLSKYRGQVIRYGVSDTCDFRATRIEYGTNGMNFTLCLQGLHYDLFVPGYGEHNVYNALAALAAVHVLGFGIAEAGEALRSFEHVERHLELRAGLNGCTMLDDTWNTNPSSIESALRVLQKIAHGKKTVAVLGEIGELGDHSVSVHQEVGAKVVERGIDVLLTFGDDSRWIAEKALELGMRRSQVHICQTMEEAYHVLQKLANKQTLILLKTSMFHSYQSLLDRLFKNE